MYSTRALFGHPNPVDMSLANFEMIDASNKNKTLKKISQAAMKSKISGGNLPSVRQTIDLAVKESRKRMSMLMPP